MTENPDEPFGGFGIAIRTFCVKARGFDVHRRWPSRDSRDAAASHDCAVQLTSKAYGDRDDVCIIGTDRASNVFDLAIWPAKDAVQAQDHTAEIAGLRKVVKDKTAGDTPEHRLWSFIKKKLEEVPETAVLGFMESNWEIGNSEGWYLECQIPERVFDALVADIVNHEVDEVDLSIHWVGGLVRDEHAPPSLPTTWGLFTLPGESRSQTLYGHVTGVGWQLQNEKPGGERCSNDPVPELFGVTFSKVLESFRKSLRERREGEDTPAFRRRSRALNALAEPIAKWCEANRKEPGATFSYLRDAEQFIELLDTALHPEKGPFKDEFFWLWQHRSIAHLYKTMKPSQREEFIGRSELDDVVSTYLEKKWLQCPYLDWLLLDALTANAIVVLLEQFLKARNGISYALFEGSRWKMFLWKVVTKPLVFLLGWIAPAVVCYFIAQWSWPVGIGLAVLYYGASLIMLCRWLWYRLQSLLTGKRTPSRKTIELIEALERTYTSLAGPVLYAAAVRSAFQKAEDVGVSWDHKVYYLLDRVSQQQPSVWRNQPSSYY